MQKNQGDGRPPQRKRRKIRWGRVILSLCVLCLIAFSFFWGTVWIYDNVINPAYRKAVQPPETKHADERLATDAKLNERINVLLLGIDDGDSETEQDDPKRTDAILLLSFDPKRNHVAILSVPRDTRVILPGHRDYEKINAAYAYGGVIMTKQTVEKLLRVPIHYYALANWHAFIDIVDQFGGVNIYVDKDMYYEDPYANLVIDIKRGYQHMDGKTAGKYVRYRSDELGDIGRVQRQQKFLKAAAKQIFSLQNVSKIGSLVSNLDKYVETDLNTLTMLKAANSFSIFGEDKIKSCMLYGDFDDITGISYWVVDRASVNKSLDELGIPHLADDEQEK